MDKVRDLLGDDAAALAAAPRRADPHAHRGRADRADRDGPAADAARRAEHRRQRAARAVHEPHQGPDRSAPGAAPRVRPRAQPATPSRTSTATRSGSTSSARSATPSSGAAVRRRRASRRARRCDSQPDDFEIEQTEHLTRSSTVLMLDLSMSMPMEGRFVPAKKVAMALHSLISSQFPRDYLGVVVFSETARVIKPEQIPEASWDYVYGTNMHHGAHARPPAARPPARHEADHHGHRRRADRPRHARRRGVLPLPAGERDRRGDAARGAALHPGRHPHQHVHARCHRSR